MKVKVLKPANSSYVKEGQILDLPDHIAKAGIKKGLFADAKPKAKAKPRKAKK